MTGGRSRWTQSEWAAHDKAVRDTHALVKQLAHQVSAIRDDFMEMQLLVDGITRTALQKKGAAKKKPAKLEDILGGLVDLTKSLADSTKSHTRQIDSAEAHSQQKRITNILDLLRRNGSHAGALAGILVELYARLGRLEELYGA